MQILVHIRAHRVQILVHIRAHSAHILADAGNLYQADHQAG
jgi:hypothetical protein